MKKILIIIFIFNFNLLAKTKADYYEMLRTNCKTECCYFSYQIMKRNQYILATDTKNCLNIDQLNCDTTYHWCIDITYDKNIYQKKLNF